MHDGTAPLCPNHFDGQRYFNPDAQQARGWWDVLRWKLTTRPAPSPRFIDDVSLSRPPARVTDTLRVTIINHSTVLLQQDGANILTDPIWSERASPFTRIGPRRHRSPGLRLDDLPPLDVVLLSHNHYDHLDLATLRRLVVHGSFIMPCGVAPLLRSHNIGLLHELDWGDSVQNGATTIHCVPAVHFSPETSIAELR